MLDAVEREQSGSCASAGNLASYTAPSNMYRFDASTLVASPDAIRRLCDLAGPRS
jgi:hypothetical protein